jgi:hypothetical protein
MSIVRLHTVRPLLFAPFALSLSGCAVIGGIFKAGVWVGVLAVALVVGLLLGVVRMLGGSN